MGLVYHSGTFPEGISPYLISSRNLLPICHGVGFQCLLVIPLPSSCFPKTAFVHPLARFYEAYHASIVIRGYGVFLLRSLLLLVWFKEET